jgi:hypothetical protein
MQLLTLGVNHPHRTARNPRTGRVRPGKAGACAARTDAEAGARPKSRSCRPATAPNCMSTPRSPDEVTQWLADFHHIRTPRACALSLCATARAGGATCLPCRRRAGLDGARRNPDPRSDETGGSRQPRKPAPSACCCTSCFSALSRSPRKSAAAPKSARTRYQWPPPRYALPNASFPASAIRPVCSSARAR